MGQYISFYKNRSGKPLKELIFERYAEFRVWYLQRNQDSIAEFYETYGSEELLAYFEQNSDFENDFETLDDRLINELLVEFVWEYGGYQAPGEYFFQPFGSNVGTWRYVESTEMVFESDNSELIQLWTYLVLGRTLKDSTDFNSFDGEDKIKVGFLTVEEQNRLRELISHHFGDVHAATDNYWSTTAVEEYKKAGEGPFQGRLTTYNPPTAGLSYVLSALEDIKDDQAELVTTIE
jgi:hypothetical protein